MTSVERRAACDAFVVFRTNERISRGGGLGRRQRQDEIGRESGAAQHDPSPGAPVLAAQRHHVRGKARARSTRAFGGDHGSRETATNLVTASRDVNVGSVVYSNDVEYG